MSNYRFEMTPAEFDNYIIRAKLEEQERIIALIEAQIAECGEDCDYCIAQADIIEAIREQENV